MVTYYHMRLLSNCNVASVNEKVNFKFHLTLFHLNLNNCMWLMAATLDSLALSL